MWQLRMHCNLRPPDVAPIILGCFWPNLCCASARTDIFRLPFKILISLLDSVTPIWRSKDRFTPWHLPLTRWPWTRVVNRLLGDQTLYQIWAKSVSPRLSYNDLLSLKPRFFAAFCVFSERELCCRPSVCRLSVTFVRPTQAIEIFGNVSTPFGTFAIHDLSVKILRRSSQGNPSVEGVKHTGCSQI